MLSSLPIPVQVAHMKENYDYRELKPPELLRFLNHINLLEYTAMPDYDMLAAVFTDGFNDTEPYDWEQTASELHTPRFHHQACSTPVENKRISTGNAIDESQVS